MQHIWWVDGALLKLVITITTTLNIDKQKEAEIAAQTKLLPAAKQPVQRQQRALCYLQ